MKLLEIINKDFKEAYLKREMVKKDYLGFLKSEVTKETKTPDDAYILGKFKAMVKNGIETNSLTEFELNILRGYIPSQMSKDKLSDIIGEFIKLNGLESKRNMGVVMTHLKDTYPGEYDGKMASELVRELL